jgi:hypothetical protein
MRRRLALFLAISIAAPASAQAALYDAGTAGNPPVPPEPVTQGWSLVSGGGVGLDPIADDGCLNAWEITDALAGPGAHARYAHDLFGALGHLLDVGWELTVTLEMTAGEDPSIDLEFTDGTHVFPANPATPVAPCTPGTSSAGTGT